MVITQVLSKKWVSSLNNYLGIHNYKSTKFQEKAKKSSSKKN